MPNPLLSRVAILISVAAVIRALVRRQRNRITAAATDSGAQNIAARPEQPEAENQQPQAENQQPQAENQQPSPPSLLTSIKEWLAVAATAIALGGAISYGFLRETYDRFYEEFGLTVADLGIDARVILDRAAPTGEIFVLALIVVTALVLAGAAIRPRLEPKLPGGDGVWPALVGLLLLLAWVPTYFTSSDVAPLAGALSTYVAFGLLVRARYSLVVLAAITAFLYFSILLYHAPRNAEAVAACAKKGTIVRFVPARSAQLPIGPAAQVKITSTKPETTSEFGNRRLVYFGNKDGFAIFWDPQTKAPVRIPASELTIRSMENSSACLL